MHFLNKNSVKVFVFTFVLTAAISVPVFAADKELLDILLGNGAITQSQYDALMEKEELAAEDIADIGFSDDGGLNVRSQDGSYEIEIGGRMHLDFVEHSYDRRIGSSPVSGSQLRRARLELDGAFNESWVWAAEVDFAGNDTDVKDFRLGYEMQNGTAIHIGNQKQPYSLSLEMSSNDEPFVERSIDNELVVPFTDRALGVRAQRAGDNWFVAAGAFGEGVNSGESGNEGWGTAARFVYTPVLDDQRVLHLGVRHAFRAFSPGSEVPEISDQTSDFSELSIVSTGPMHDAENIALFGPEFAMAWGPLFVFGEYNDARIERTDASSLNFDSWHVAAAWTLTGESRAERYSIEDGEFTNLRPASTFDPASNSFGVIELAARYAVIDLNDGAFVGGDEETVSLALNWQPNNNVRLMADWTRIVDTDDSNMIRRFAPETDIFTFRTQYNY